MRRSETRDADENLMRRAVTLAERALGETNPNPMVGCVLAKNGRVIGEGFHARAGLLHAEPSALLAAGARARGATVYVTLEPCAPNAQKRTPACAPLLIEAGVARVVVGVRDQNPRVKGRGLRALRRAGIEVVEGVLGEECARLTRHFNVACARQLPWVCLKAGMTLDGRIATASGVSKWITSPAQRRAARSLRRLFDAVVVGIGTAATDDPLLLPEPAVRRPFARVVLDPKLRLPPDSRLVASADRHPLILLCEEGATGNREALAGHGAMILSVRSSRGRLEVDHVLDTLFALGMSALLVEGGSEVHGSFVRARRFDEFVMFRAPLILGGRASRGVVGGDDPPDLLSAARLRRARPADSQTVRYGIGADSLDVEVYEPSDLRETAAGSSR